MRPRLVPSLVRLFWSEDRTRYQLVATTALVLPVTIGYLAGRLEGDVSDRAVAIGVTTAFMTAASQVGSAVLHDRFSGRLEVLRALPLRSGPYVATRLVLGLLESLAILTIAFAAIALLGWTTFRGKDLGDALILSSLGSISLAALATLIASRAASMESGWTGVSLTTLGLLLASPVLYTLEQLPPIVRSVAWLSPFTHLAPGIRAVLSHQALPWQHTLALSLLAAGLAGAAVRYGPLPR